MSYDGIADEMLARARPPVSAGVNVIVLLALNDDGLPAYDANHTAILASLGCFACTPHQFAELMATALNRQDIWAWAAAQEVKPVRPQDGK